MEQNENTLSVLKIAPGQYPQQVEIDNDLKALQQVVGGSIGASYPFEDTASAMNGSVSSLPILPESWSQIIGTTTVKISAPSLTVRS